MKESTFKKSLSILVVFTIISVGSVAIAHAQADFTLVDLIATEHQGTLWGSIRLAMPPDGSRLYAQGGHNNSTPCPQGTESLIVINPVTRQIDDLIPCGPSDVPGTMAVTSDGSKVYIPYNATRNSCSSPRVAVIDTTTSTSSIIFTGGSIYGPKGAAITPDDTHVYVTHCDNLFVHVIDIATDTIVNNVSVDAYQLVGIAISHDGKYAYAVDRTAGFKNVIVIDTASNTQIMTIPLSIHGLNSENHITITPDGRRAYVTDDYSSIVSAIDIDPASPNFHTEVAAIQTTGGETLGGLAVTPDGDAVLVTSLATHELLVIDSDSASPTFHTQIGAVALPAQPRDVVTDPSPDGFAYVSLPGIGAIGVIERVPTTQEVRIDIRPGSYPNCFNNNGHGVIPVAILSTDEFDATQVNPETITLDGQPVRVVGKKGRVQAHIEDVNGDGRDDLVLQIENVDGVYEQDDEIATLTGETFDGVAIEGTDSICIVPKKQKSDH